ncbi:diacylglycerol kinase [Massilia horti]|uniref:Diacylglycerol kinase n=1 Tax=Massilia horti TaxID=2562153 RepID=A0A4Y9SUK2_9BURK|nr:diacylglycerol kinase [Massilia horti]TFW30482.1 diacylglycerol kinase [Massilia horti]TFW30599.1 diacylglycerol kinase [Massilia horti]
MEPMTSEFKGKRGWRRIVTATANTTDGLVSAWRNESAFRQETVALLVGSVVAFLLKISAFERFVLIGVLVLVLIVELINSALEAVVDRISLERHPLSKNAKDFGSAAVALAIGLATAAWVVVLYNRFL